MKKVDLEREARRLEREARRLRKRAKRELRKFLEQQKTTKALARYYRVSESTIERRIGHYGLTGLRKRGRKPFVKKPKPPKPKREWISTKKYIDDLNNVYKFLNIQYIPFKFINPKTLVCSNTKRNPKGKFTTVGVYFIVEQSDVYFINYTRVRYSDKPADLAEIHDWAKENMNDILSVQFQRASFSIERIIALTFLLPEKKPKVIKAKGR